MHAIITTRPPTHDALHLDLSGRGGQTDQGALLTLTDPREILAAAKRSADGVDWVVWHLSTMPTSERRVAAFAVSIARAVPGSVFIVLDPQSGRDSRIAGHLLRAGASRATGE